VTNFGVDLTVADLNADGFADIVGYWQANVRCYLSSGPNRLLHDRLMWFQDAKAIATGDFNGDQNLDIAVATASSITLMTGDGTGQFSNGSSFGSFKGKIWAVASGDFTGDGMIDLAVGADDIVIYRGDGKGGFAEFSRVPQVTSGSSGAIGTLLAVDLRKTGKLDLVAAAYGTPNVTILVGDGNGHFTVGSQVALSGGTIGAATGDLNEDGHLDLALTDFALNTNFARPFLGNGMGSFTAGVPANAGPAPYSVAAADFDQDGHIDLAVADFTTGTLLTMPETSMVLFGDGQGNFPRSLTLTAGSQPNAIATADIDGDSFPDIVLTNAGSGDFYVFINDQKGSFLPPYAFAVAPGPTGFAIGDVNNDGRPDVITVVQNGIEVAPNLTPK